MTSRCAWMICLLAFSLAACGTGTTAGDSNLVAEERVGTTACDSEALDAFEAFPVTDEAPATKIQFVGRLESMTQVAASSFTELRFSADEESWTLRVAGLSEGLPIKIGSVFDVTLEYVGGWPAACALVIADEEGLLFAAMSDQGLASHVLDEGIEGFEFELLPTECDSRQQSDCVDAIRNRVLRVSAGEEAAELYQGESARIGGYKLECRVAQDSDYNSSCADVSGIGVSFVIRR